MCNGKHYEPFIFVQGEPRSLPQMIDLLLEEEDLGANLIDQKLASIIGDPKFVFCNR
jgi:hypothetical protein